MYKLILTLIFMCQFLLSPTALARNAINSKAGQGNDISMLKRAVDSVDVISCDSIVDDATRYECYTRIALNNNDATVIEKNIADITYADPAYRRLAVLQNDATVCAQIIDTQMQQVCQKQIDTEATNGTDNARMSKQFQLLKDKTLSGKKVRIIAKLSGVKVGKVRSNVVSAEFKQMRDKVKSMGMQPQREITRLGLIVLEVDDHALDKLYNSGLIEQIHEDYSVQPNLTESVPYIGAATAQSRGFIGQGHAVVILDTGVQTDHAFLGGRVVEEACFSSNSSSTRSLCPNRSSTQIGKGAGIDCTRTGIDGCFHGTHVAGIATGNAANIKGVATSASIVAVQVFVNKSGQLDGFTSDLLAALEWVLNSSTTSNIAAVNMSLGYSFSSSFCDNSILAGTIKALRDVNIATVVASGNDGSSTGTSFPACVSSAITVGSTLKNADKIISNSNSAKMVDLLAPGVNIISSFPENKFAILSGTSMAAPHVAGTFALIRSAKPNASVSEIEAILKATGARITDSRNGMTFSRISVNSAVDAITAPPEPPAPKPTVSLLASPSTVLFGGSSTVTWSSTDADSCTYNGNTISTSGSAVFPNLTQTITLSLTCTGPGGSASASTTITVPSQEPEPTVSLSASPSTVSFGGSSSVTWSSTNADSCVYNGNTINTSGSAVFSNLTQTTTLTLTCTGAGGSATKSITITVIPPKPVVNLSASPSTVISGGASTVTWSSSYADKCVYNGSTINTSGSAVFSNLTTNTTLSLTCTGVGGSTTKSTTITVLPPKPTVNLSASPSRIGAGESSTVTWSSTNATSCTYNGNTISTSGSTVFRNLTSSITLSLTCTGPGGSASASTSISVFPI